MNTTTINDTDANMMTGEQMEHFILEHCFTDGIDGVAPKTKALMDAMSNATTLRFYGQVCGLDAMAWAQSDGSEQCLDKISSLDILLEIVGLHLQERGYVPQI